MAFAYGANLAPFHLCGFFLLVVPRLKQMNRQALRAWELILTFDLPDLQSVCVPKVNGLIVMPEATEALTLADVQTFLAAPKRINNRAIEFPLCPPIKPVEPVGKSEAFNESKPPTNSRFCKFSLGVFVNQNSARREEYFLFESVANSPCVFLGCALVRSDDQSSKLLGPALHSVVKDSHELGFQRHKYSPKAIAATPRGIPIILQREDNVVVR